MSEFINPLYMYDWWHSNLSSPETAIVCVGEVIVHIILFVGALVGSIRSSQGIPIPGGIAKFIILLLLLLRMLHFTL